MPEAAHIGCPAPYAGSADFRRIFSEEMDELHELSFLLTGDREKAEQCLVSGLEDTVKGRPVFKEWARSWARRAIIQCAVRVINPRPMEEGDPSTFDSSRQTRAVEREDMSAILELRPFERFVYVMSVIERYSDQDCAVLLGCARRDVVAARIRALQQLDCAGVRWIHGLGPLRLGAHSQHPF